ncbi:hypothetical protein [Streptomyces sp. CB03911]|uniref:allene oxide cyclase barrel-like domain-containing protein n=1 Tax=Streptomycetaceae TaxID=2062 RepID=UPI0025700429|nr:hypothetical protein [Streptomyces sp. CB03911]
MASITLPGPLGTAADSLRGWLLARLAVPPFGPKGPNPAVGEPENLLYLTDLVETLVSYDSNNEDFEGASPTLDDLAHVRYELRDQKGVLLGATKGIGQMLRKGPEGNFLAYFSEEIRLLDGTVIRTGGVVDDARLTAGEQQTIKAVAVAGPLRGAIGFRQFRPVETHKSYASAIVLYRR